MQRLRSILTSKSLNTNDPCRPTSYRVNPAFEDDLDSEDINAQRRGAAGRRHGRKHLFRRSRALPDHRPRTSSTLHRGTFTSLLLALHILSSPIAITLLQILTIVHSNQTVKVLEGLQDGAFLPLNGTRVIRPVAGSADGSVGFARKSRRTTVVFEGFGSVASSAVSDQEGRSSAKEERGLSGVRATMWKRTSGLVTNELEASASTLQESTYDNEELIVSEACATYLNEPIEWIARFKISSLTLTIFQIWILVILGVAWYHASSSHLGAVALSQTLVSCFAIAQAAFTYEHYASFASGILLGPCSLGQPLIPEFWSLTVKSQIAVAVLQLFGSVVIAVFAVNFANVRLRWPNFGECNLSSLRSWAFIQPHGHYGASNEPSQHARLLVSSFELLSTSSIFFVIAFQAVWLRETIHRPSPAFDFAPSWLGVPEQIGVGVLMVLGTYVMTMGQVGLRFRFRSVMVLSLLGNLAFLLVTYFLVGASGAVLLMCADLALSVHNSCLLSQSTFRVVQASSSFLSFLLVISTALVLLTFVLGTATTFSRPVWSSIGAEGSEVAQSDSSYDDGDAKFSDLNHSTPASKDLSSPGIVDYRRPKPGQAHVQSHILNRPPSTNYASNHPRHSRLSSTSTINTTGKWKESVFGQQRSRSMSLELATSRMIPLRSLGSQTLVHVDLEAPATQSLRSERMTPPSERGIILAMANEDLIDKDKDETDLFRQVTPRRLRNPSKASIDVPMPAIPDEDTLGVGGDDPFRPVTPRRLRQPSVPLDAEDAEDVDAIVAGEAAVRSSARGVDRGVDPFTWTTAEPFATTTASKDEFLSHSKSTPESGLILSPTQATPSSPSPTRSVRAPKGPPTSSAVPKTNLFPLSHLSLSDFLFQTPLNAPSPIPVPVPTLQITDAQTCGHGNEHDVPLRPLPQAQIYDRSKTHRVRSAVQQGRQVKSSDGRPFVQPSKEHSTMGYKPLQDASIQLHQDDRANSKSSATPTPLGPEPMDRRESVLDRPHPLVYERWTVNWPALE